MIITLGGNLGSGKSTIAKLLAKRLKYPHKSSGDLQREEAARRNVSILELGKMEEKDPSIDKMIDERQRDFGRKHKDIVLDGHLGFYFIPHSFKVFLKVDPEEGARRILTRKNANAESHDSKESTTKFTQEREASNRKRWFEFYGVDAYDDANFDLIIDTTNLSPDEIVDKILEASPLSITK